MGRNKKETLVLENAMLAFRGKKCWSVIAGEGTGSLITLAFGLKQRRMKILKNQYLTNEQQNFDGEFELYVECAWRLETMTSVICTSTSSNRRGDTMMKEIDQLVGQTVVEVGLTYPAADIKIDFDSGLSLVIFADQANEVDEYCNYVVSTDSRIIVNGAKSQISLQARPQPSKVPGR
jgi:hypothetical protein